MICGKYEYCKNGKCICKEEDWEIDSICKPKFCKPYPGVKCREGQEDDPMKIHYYCDDGKMLIENAVTKLCKDKCDIPNLCEHTCSPFEDSYICGCFENFKLNEKNKYSCIRESEECKEPCRENEICIINKNGKEECKCRNNYEKINGICKDKCTANKVGDICPSSCKKDRTYGFVCDCTGKYRLSSNNVTCESFDICAEREQGFTNCQSIGAFCKNKNSSYECVCPEWLTKNKSNNLCIDLCTFFKKTEECKQTFSECVVTDYINKKVECRCPASMKMVNGLCQFVEISYLGNIILPNRYRFNELSDSSLNKIKRMNEVINLPKLRTDIESAMIVMYGSLLENVNVLGCNIGEQLDCTIELQFGKKVKNELIREINNVDNCKSTTQDEYCVFPPNLLVLKESQKSAIFTETNQCNYTVVDKFCPNFTNCIKDDVGYSCKCKHGYRTVSSEPLSGNQAYTKDICEEWCNPNPCKNGECIVRSDVNEYICKCNEGYHGTNCADKDVSTKTAVIVGVVTGSLLLFSLIIIIILLIRIRNVKKISTSSQETLENFRPSYLNLGNSENNMLRQERGGLDSNLRDLRNFPRINQVKTTYPYADRRSEAFNEYL